MNARDELQKVIFEYFGPTLQINAFKTPEQQDEELADAILAAGYRKPRTVTTAEELDKLSEGVILRASHGGVWTRVVDGLGAAWRCAGPRNHCRADEIELPATILYEPARP